MSDAGKDDAAGDLRSTRIGVRARLLPRCLNYNRYRLNFLYRYI